MPLPAPTSAPVPARASPALRVGLAVMPLLVACGLLAERLHPEAPGPGLRPALAEKAS